MKAWPDSLKKTKTKIKVVNFLGYDVSQKAAYFYYRYYSKSLGVNAVKKAYVVSGKVGKVRDCTVDKGEGFFY